MGSQNEVFQKYSNNQATITGTFKLNSKECFENVSKLLTADSGLDVFSIKQVSFVGKGVFEVIICRPMAKHLYDKIIDVMPLKMLVNKTWISPTDKDMFNHITEHYNFGWSLLTIFNSLFSSHPIMIAHQKDEKYDGVHVTEKEVKPKKRPISDHRKYDFEVPKEAPKFKTANI